MKKKKLILALLASVCVATGAAGVAACTGGGATSRDPAIFAAYEDYTKTCDNPLSYEQWLADLIAKFEEGGEKGPAGDNGEDGVSIKSVNTITLNGTQYYEFIFTSGKVVRLSADGDKITTTSFTVIAVDQNGAPVKNAYFSIGYRNGLKDYYMKADGAFVEGVDDLDFSSIYAVKSNSKGIATFHVFPESEHDFNVYIADSSSIDSENGDVNGIPNGYSINFGKSADGLFNLNYAPFVKGEDGNYSVTLKFVIDNNWNTQYDSDNDLQYNRYVPDYTMPEKIIEDYEPYTKSALKSRYNYFSFEPAKAVYPDGVDDSVRDYIDDLARKAASGVYRISWKASNPAANVQLMYYAFFNGYYFFSYEDGSPRDNLVKMHSGNLPTDEQLLQQRYKEGGGSQSYAIWLNNYSAKFSGTNYIDIEVTYDYSHLQHCLAFIADMNCDVTISVERIGDVPEWSDVYVNAELPADATQTNDQNGRIIDVPLNSTVVKGDDGYYHLDSKTGPIIYVQLKDGTRANDLSILALTSQEVSDGSINGTTTKSFFDNYITEEFDDTTNSGVRTHTNYTQVIKDYANFANSDGLYPVNDQIKTILDTFCKNSSWSSYQNYWLAACSYYGAPADGSADSPYDVKVGRTAVELNGTTHIAFKTTTSAYYGFSSTNGEIGMPDGVNVAGVYYVNVTAYQEFTFTVTGSGTTNVNVVTIADAKIIEFSYDNDNNKDVGTESNPVTITGGAVYQININHNMSNGNRVAVDMSAMFDLDGEFKITMYGSDTATVVDANGQDINGQNITVIYAGTPTRFYVDDITDGTFFIKIERMTQD